jgi:uncharacterized repeat protein (TIGR01451 family)
VDVKVTVHFHGAAGEQSVLAVGTAKAYVAQLPRPFSGPVTIVAEDDGAGHFLAGKKDVGDTLPQEVPFELQFAKPALSVVYNPNFQLLHMRGKNTSEEDLKDQVWALFQSLCSDQKWKDKFGYQYLMSAYEDTSQPGKVLTKILVAKEDTVQPFGSADRDAAFSEFHFKDQPVVADAAIRDFGDFLKGFSYPSDQAVHGVLVYILGAPPSPVLRDDSRFAQWDSDLSKGNMMAVVAAFMPGETGEKERILTTDRQRNLRYLQFGVTEESQSDFRHAFEDIQSAIGDLLNPGGAPRLTITSAHPQDFEQGQDATYALTVSNAEGAGASSGAVSVRDTLPSGLQLVSMEGAGWSCDKPPTAYCTRSDTLAPGKKYDPITVKVKVSLDALSSVSNKVTVAFGGSKTVDKEDATDIRPAPSVTTIYEYRAVTPDDKKTKPGWVQIEITSKQKSITVKLNATDIPASWGLPKSTGYNFPGIAKLTDNNFPSLRFHEPISPNREDEIEIVLVQNPPSLELVWKDGRRKNGDALFDELLKPKEPGQ